MNEVDYTYEASDLYTSDISYEGEPEALYFDCTFAADLIILESDGQTDTRRDERVD